MGGGANWGRHVGSLGRETRESRDEKRKATGGMPGRLIIVGLAWSWLKVRSFFPGGGALAHLGYQDLAWPAAASCHVYIF